VPARDVRAVSVACPLSSVFEHRNNNQARDICTHTIRTLSLQFTTFSGALNSRRIQNRSSQQEAGLRPPQCEFALAEFAVDAEFAAEHLFDDVLDDANKPRPVASRWFWKFWQCLVESYRFSNIEAAGAASSVLSASEAPERVGSCDKRTVHVAFDCGGVHSRAGVCHLNVHLAFDVEPRRDVHRALFSRLEGVGEQP
jgi:hypothetical protein